MQADARRVKADAELLQQDAQQLQVLFLSVFSRQGMGITSVMVIIFLLH